MKVVIRVDVSDAQRVALACAIKGKPTLRLATREEFNDYVQGCLALLVGLGDIAMPPVQAAQGMAERVADQEVGRNPSRFTDANIAEWLRLQGKSEGYIRGYLAAGKRGAP